MANKRNHKRARIPRSFAPRSIRTLATYVTQITSSSGAFTLQMPASGFGLSSGSTFPLQTAFLLPTTSSNSAYFIRPMGLKVSYQPLFGPSISYSSGFGYAAFCQNVGPTTPTLTNLADVSHKKKVCIGVPFTMRWKPTLANDKLWMPSNTSLFETNVYAGFQFVMFLTQCATTQILGELTFEWMIEARLP